MSDRFLRRSLLYVPSCSEKMLDKAIAVDADAVIFDLEDSVSPEEKEKARKNVEERLEGKAYGKKEVIVRINSPDTPWGVEDMIKILPLSPDAIILPKADRVSVSALSTLMHALSPGGVRMIPLIETPASIVDAYEILGLSGFIDGVQLGAEDLTREMEVKRTGDGNEILYAREMLVFAAKARKVDVLDTPYTSVKDIDGLRRDARLAKSLGFTGKVCIHPSHIDVINEVFSPGKEDAEEAEELLKLFDLARKDGKGAFSYKGKMVDSPVAERARGLLERYKAIGNL